MSVVGYRWYGGSGGEFFGHGSIGSPLVIGGVDGLGNATGGEGTVWDALTAGTQITNLFNEADQATAVAVGDAFGNYRVQAPDAYGELYVDTGGAKRYPMQPMDVGSRVLALEVTGIGDFETTTGSQAKADAAVETSAGYTNEQVAELGAATVATTTTGLRIESGPALPAASAFPPGTIFIVTPA